MDPQLQQSLQIGTLKRDTFRHDYGQAWEGSEILNGGWAKEASQRRWYQDMKEAATEDQDKGGRL